MSEAFDKVKREELDKVYDSVLRLERTDPIAVNVGFMRDIIHELKVLRYQVSKLGNKAAAYKKELAAMKEGK